MMILSAYLARALLGGVVLTLVAVVALVSLAALVDELGDVGEGRYGFVDAVAVVGLSAPERAFDLLAVSALIGGVLGLGGLATRNELVVLRASGISPFRVAGALVVAALPLVLLMAVLAELVIPPLSQEAARIKRVSHRGPDAALTEQAVWLRDGRSIVRVGAVRPDGLLEDLQLYGFRSDGSVDEVLRASTARILSLGRWELTDVRRDRMGGDEQGSELMPRYEIPSPLSSRSVSLLISPPNTLSVSRLWRESSGGATLATGVQVRGSLWQKLTAPFLMMAMVCLAVPFAYGTGGVGGIGRRLGLGAVIGVLAHFAVQAIAYLGALLDLDPAVVAVAPAVLTLCVAILMISRLR